MPVPSCNNNLTISLVALPETAASVLYGFYEVFSCVGGVWSEITGQPAAARSISTNIVASTKELFFTPQALPVLATHTFSDRHRANIVIVPEVAIMPDEDPRGRWPEASRWIAEQYEAGAVICSACNGALLLADMGLLDTQEATTHWSMTEVFAKYYPGVNLRPERVLLPTAEGHRIVTSGGAAAWNDLALYLVARFCGEAEARNISKMFLFGDRGQGQMPFATRVRPKQHNDAIIAKTQTWVSNNYSHPTPVQAMTEYSGLPQRTFKRRFRAATGYAPLDYVQTLRIEEAKQMLEASNLIVDDIAFQVGYEDVNSFRRLFKRETGLAPNAYRQKFKSVVMIDI